MTAPNFEPARRTVEELVAGSDYFLIPRFQRPYSWDRGNIDEFWRDAIEDNELGYFIGPMVGWRHNVNTAELYVVDGQQRLTTLMLLLAAIRNQLRALGQGKLSDGVHRYIEKPDREQLKVTFNPKSAHRILITPLSLVTPMLQPSPPVATTRRSRRRIAILVLASR